MLVTIYFALGSLLSMYGCQQYVTKTRGNRADRLRMDAEHNLYADPITERCENARHTIKNSMFDEEHNVRKIAGFWGYAFQIIYQTNAGAVMLTDCVFWFIIFPFLTIKHYDLNFILIGMHSVNAIFLLGDTALNNLASASFFYQHIIDYFATSNIIFFPCACFQRFPWFRISYFLLWTSGFVIFQWLLHTFVSLWWPYPFLDLSSPQAPLWYLLVAVMHIPCYAIFPVIIKMKHRLLSTWFPESHLPTYTTD